MRRLVVIVAATLAFAACARGPSTEAPREAKRVVSLSPSTTEAMFAIGAGDQLVGRSRYCDYPPEAARLPQVGGYVDASLEAILGLRPTLVVGARGPAGPKLEETLASHAVATFFPETESLAQIDTMLRMLGAKTGHETEAAREVARMDAHEQAIAAAVASLPKVRTLLVFDADPIVVAGPHGFPDELVAAAGGVNVVTEGTAYPTLGVERVVALDPDVILDASMSPTHASALTRDAPGWREVGAVKRGRVVAIADEAVLRPGPRIDSGLATIARALHPGVALP